MRRRPLCNSSHRRSRPRRRRRRRGGCWGKGVEGAGGEARADDDLAGLVAGGHETDGLRGDVEGADGVYDVDDCRAGADANVGEGGGEVVCDCADGGGAFGGFDVGH